nr:P27 family phage terminase small subunit [uncultured Undibacterium sp.]
MTRPTPTAIKKLSGNAGRRPLTVNEPKPPTGSPACPAWLTGDALEEWKRIVPALDLMGVLTKVDHSILIGHCVTYGEIAATAKSGEPLKAALLGQMRAYAAELGLTPAARAKLSIAPPAKGDDFAQFFQ